MPVPRAWPRLALLAGTLVACARTPAAGPHVVLLSIDTLRADHVGLYGSSRDTTPNLDRFFGAGGSVFENAISSAPCTIPSVRQYLAGALDDRPERPTLAETLREHGYTTAAIVSQHQFYRGGLEPYRRGFERFDIQGREQVDHHGWTARRASEVSDRAVAWLEANAQRGKLFLWLHYFDPHDPYEPPEPFRGFAGDDAARGGDRRTVLRELHERQGSRAPSRSQWSGEGLDPADAARFVALYDGEVRYVDAEIGRVLAALERLGLARRSIVVLIADHGEWLGERGRWDHCATLSQRELAVPLLVRVNGRPLGAPRQAVAASTLDVVPTLLGLLGIPYDPEAYHGLDLRRAAPDRAVIAVWGGAKAIRDREWKLLYQRERHAFLYRVGADAAEQWNLLEEHPEVARELDRRMGGFEELSERVAAENEETIEQLRAIGYIE